MCGAFIYERMRVLCNMCVCVCVRVFVCVVGLGFGYSRQNWPRRTSVRRLSGERDDLMPHIFPVHGSPLFTTGSKPQVKVILAPRSSCGDYSAVNSL